MASRMTRSNARLRAAGGAVKAVRLRPRAFRALLLARIRGEHKTDQEVIEIALVRYAASFPSDHQTLLRDAPHQPIPLGAKLKARP